MKRAFDFLAASIGLVLLSPLFALIAVIVKLTSAGPVFYLARRVGRGGGEFLLYKFRTMRTGNTGPAITAKGDPRVTRIGRILRKSKLDELPQLINVVKGEMSLVGPRPEDPRYVALYTPEQRRILDVRPGITSMASLTYRNEEELLSGESWEETYRNEVMPAKLRIDLDYMRRATFFTDLGLIVRTVRAMFPSRESPSPGGTRSR